MVEYIDKEEAINRIREWEQYVVDSMRKCPIFGELNERYIQQKCSGLEMAIRIIKGIKPMTNDMTSDDARIVDGADSAEAIWLDYLKINGLSKTD